jgi:PAS domain S-box-containing protein
MKINTQRLLALLLVVCFALLPLSISSTPVSADDAITLRVGLYENSPKIFTAPNGDAAGFWPEIIEYIAAEEGWEIDYVHGTWSENLNRLENNEIDIMPDVAYAEERAARYEFSNETVYVSWSRVYAREGTDIESILDLGGKTVAVLQGSVNVEGPEGIKVLVSEFDIDCTFLETDSYTEVFELVESGEADAGVTSKDFGYQHEDDFNLVQTAIIFQPSSLYFAFPQDSSLTPYLIERIDSHMRALKADEGSIYYQALANWFGIEVGKEPVVPGWLTWMLIAIGGMAILFGGGYLFLSSRVRARTKELEQEINQRQQTEEALREIEAFQSELLSNSPIPISVINADSSIRYVNPALEKLTGFAAEELLWRKPPYPYWPEERQREIMKGFKKAMRKGETRAVELFRKKSGEGFWVEITTTPVRKEGKFQYLLASWVDVTERKRAEETLKRSEASLAEAQRVAHIGSWELDLVSDTLTWSDEVYRMFGLKPRQFGATYEAFLDNIHPDDREMVNKAYTDSLKNKTPYDIVHRLLLKDGTMKYVNERCETFYDEKGKPFRSLGTVQDITERKRAEETLKKWSRELENRVRQRTAELEQRSQELAEANVRLEEMSRHKSQFLANMSHELRTPLNSIIGYTKLMLDGLEGEITEEQRQDLQTVYNNSQNLLALINSLLDLSKIEAGKVTVTNEAFTITELLDDVLPAIEQLAKAKDLSLEYSVDPAINHLYADRAKTKQTLINILGNAIKFTEKGSIRLNISEGDGEFIFTVSDTGLGIKKEDLKVIFDSFKQVGPAQIAGFEGTGLGLSISRQFVKMQGGRIWAESEPGKGSTFTFTLPKRKVPKARRR